MGLGGGYWFSKEQTNSQRQQVNIVLQQVVSNLPAEKRRLAEGIIESVSQVVNIANGSESEMREAAFNFRKLIDEASLLSYDVVDSPLPLTQQRTALLCEGAFSIAYQLDNANGSQRFLVNGNIYSGIPGHVFKIREGEKQLQLRYMEYLTKTKAAIIDFECS